MEKTEAKRQLILNQIADHLLAAGLKDASLRHLAAAIGASDRMLLHYFVDKDELMTAAHHTAPYHRFRLAARARRAILRRDGHDHS